MARQPQYGASTAELDEVEFHTPLADQPEFKLFAARMIDTLKSLDYEPAHREFKELLGVTDKEIRWWNAAVSWNFEEMEYYQRGARTFYRARELRRTPLPSINPPMHIRRGRGINLAKTETQITPDSFGRKVTA